MIIPKKHKKHKNQNNQYNQLVMFSVNAAGLNKKVHSLKYQVKECNAAVFTVQETNFKKKGRFKFEEFEIFETIRQNKEKRRMYVRYP